MSYSIDLIDKNTNEVQSMNNPQIVLGGTFRAEYDSKTGQVVPAKQKKCSINITYNYSRYYYEATEGDNRFAWDRDGEVDYGIRGLYGKTAQESIDMIIDLIKRISKKYKDDIGDWIVTTRTRDCYFDKNGNKIEDVIYAFINHIEYTKTQEEFKISEGSISNYWIDTAANAIKPLWDMLYMAMENVLNENAVWDGD